MSRRALGRGLDALFPQVNSPGNDLVELNVESIDPGIEQPRHDFNETKLAELANSIETNGVIQPIVVRRVGERFQIIAGERRWRAAKKVGLKRIPSVVREVPDERVLELSLIENIQRQELNAIEEANAYRKLQEQLGITQEAVALRVGKDRSSVANSLRLLRLPDHVQRLLVDGKLSMGHARALLSIDSPDRQNLLADEIVSKLLSVREAERLVKTELIIDSPRQQKSVKTSPAHDPETANVVAAEARLSRKLGAQVKIKFLRAGGVIEIKFSSSDDLARIFDVLVQRRPE
ncbi:MAG: ParB/RepB/Spo0J family partition protein [Acidobacteriota bacterium]